MQVLARIIVHFGHQLYSQCGFLHLMLGFLQLLLDFSIRFQVRSDRTKGHSWGLRQQPIVLGTGDVHPWCKSFSCQAARPAPRGRQQGGGSQCPGSY